MLVGFHLKPGTNYRLRDFGVLLVFPLRAKRDNEEKVLVDFLGNHKFAFDYTGVILIETSSECHFTV